MAKIKSIGQLMNDLSNEIKHDQVMNLSNCTLVSANTFYYSKDKSSKNLKNIIIDNCNKFDLHPAYIDLIFLACAHSLSDNPLIQWSENQEYIPIDDENK